LVAAGVFNWFITVARSAVVYTLFVADPSDAPIWETWESVFLKTTILGDMIIERSLASRQRISRIACVPRGGLYLANILSRMLGLSGDQVICLGISKYDRENPMQAGDFKIGQLPAQSDVLGQVVLLVDEVHDTGKTASAVPLYGPPSFTTSLVLTPPATSPTSTSKLPMGGFTTHGRLSTRSVASIRLLWESNCRNPGYTSMLSN
jgi:hypothetical protein